MKKIFIALLGLSVISCTRVGSGESPISEEKGFEGEFSITAENKFADLKITKSDSINYIIETTYATGRIKTENAVFKDDTLYVYNNYQNKYISPIDSKLYFDNEGFLYLKLQEVYNHSIDPIEKYKRK